MRIWQIFFEKYKIYLTFCNVRYILHYVRYISLTEGGQDEREPEEKLKDESGKSLKGPVSGGLREGGGSNPTDHWDDRGRRLQSLAKSVHCHLQDSGTDVGRIVLGGGGGVSFKENVTGKMNHARKG